MTIGKYYWIAYCSVMFYLSARSVTLCSRKHLGLEEGLPKSLSLTVSITKGGKNINQLTQKSINIQPAEKNSHHHQKSKVIFDFAWPLVSQWSMKII